VLGNVREARELERFLEQIFGLLAPLAVLAVALFAAAWLVLRVRARYRGGDDRAAEAHRMLTQIGELRRQGGLTEAEYRSIKSRLTGRIDETASKAPPPDQTLRPDNRQHDDDDARDGI
jgi:hypothetical protein